MKPDPSCPFCKIASGELPSHKLYEDDQVMAILSIDPLRPGHSLIIPKNHWDKIWQISNNQTYEKLMSVAREVAGALNKTFNPKHIIEIAEGIEINHAHFHIIPTEKGYGEINSEHVTKDPNHDELEKIARQIKNNLS